MSNCLEIIDSKEVKTFGFSDEGNDAGKPTGASLAFIFDSTGSMHQELNQVKIGAAQILSALLANKEIVIHDFILVPFNDPRKFIILGNLYRQSSPSTERW